MQKKTLTSYQKEKIFKQIHDACKKCRMCHYCGAINGTVKKIPKLPLKVIHDKYGLFI